MPRLEERVQDDGNSGDHDEEGNVANKDLIRQENNDMQYLCSGKEFKCYMYLPREIQIFKTT